MKRLYVGLTIAAVTALVIALALVGWLVIAPAVKEHKGAPHPSKPTENTESHVTTGSDGSGTPVKGTATSGTPETGTGSKPVASTLPAPADTKNFTVDSEAWETMAVHSRGVFAVRSQSDNHTLAFWWYNDATSQWDKHDATYVVGGLSTATTPHVIHRVIEYPHTTKYRFAISTGPLRHLDVDTRDVAIPTTVRFIEWDGTYWVELNTARLARRRPTGTPWWLSTFGDRMQALQINQTTFLVIRGSQRNDAQVDATLYVYRTQQSHPDTLSYIFLLRDPKLAAAEQCELVADCLAKELSTELGVICKKLTGPDLVQCRNKPEHITTAQDKAKITCTTDERADVLHWTQPLCADTQRELLPIPGHVFHRSTYPAELAFFRGWASDFVLYWDVDSNSLIILISAPVWTDTQPVNGVPASPRGWVQGLVVPLDAVKAKDVPLYPNQKLLHRYIYNGTDIAAYGVTSRLINSLKYLAVIVEVQDALQLWIYPWLSVQQSRAHTGRARSNTPTTPLGKIELFTNLRLPRAIHPEDDTVNAPLVQLREMPNGHLYVAYTNGSAVLVDPFQDPKAPYTKLRIARQIDYTGFRGHLVGTFRTRNRTLMVEMQGRLTITTRLLPQ